MTFSMGIEYNFKEIKVEIHYTYASYYINILITSKCLCCVNVSIMLHKVLISAFWNWVAA